MVCQHCSASLTKVMPGQRADHHRVPLVMRVRHWLSSTATSLLHSARAWLGVPPVLWSLLWCAVAFTQPWRCCLCIGVLQVESLATRVLQAFKGIKWVQTSASVPRFASSLLYIAVALRCAALSRAFPPCAPFVAPLAHSLR